MMSKSPAERPASPEKVARELQQFVTGNDLQRLARGDSTANLGDSCDPSMPHRDASQRQIPRRWFAIRQIADVRVLRGSRRIRIGIRALLVAAVIACGGLAMKGVLSRGSANSRGGDASGIEPLNTAIESDGEWHNVLFKRPTPLLFQPSNGASWWSYDQDSGQVRIDSVGSAVLQFGVVDAVNYEVVAKIHQSPWTGGIGLFFGCHPTKHSAWRLQTLYVVASEAAVPGGKRSFKIQRQLEFINSIGAVQHAHLCETPISDSILGESSGATLFASHSLRFVVRNSKLAGVWFDTDSLPDLIPTPTFVGMEFQLESFSISPADSAGGFGLFCNRGAGTIMEARYRILKGDANHGS
jgi:hypothetical protein